MSYDETGGELHVVSYSRMIWSAIASVGWYVVGVAISLWYFSPVIKEKYTNWKRKRDEEEYAAKYHKNPDLLQERLSAIEESRQRMQEQYRQKTTLTQQQEEERKKKKQEAIRMLDAGLGGQRLGTKDDGPSVSSGRKSLKGEYNPLTGDSSRGYRPPKRSCCSKGGCG